MQNRDKWIPTKVVYKAGKFEPSKDPDMLRISSRLVCSLQIKSYQKAIKNYVAGRLLDMGCGHVPYLQMYEDIISEVICVDGPNSTLRNDLLDCLLDLNGVLPFESASFDSILLTDVLEHIADPTHLMREISRILKAGGVVIIGVPFLYWVHSEPFDYFRYTQYGLSELAHVAQLEIVCLEAYGGAAHVLMDIIAKCLNGARVPVLLEKVYALGCFAFLWMKALWPGRNGEPTRFPLGYSMVLRKLSNL